ncbi:MAG: hypothetical protein HY554_13010 [Elusimicrobia bacterium]|nr:hypothetical protein [Elusimicrobiota bacterium]
MKLTEKLEQLSFGKSLPEMSHCIGLYLSPTLAYVGELAMDGAKPKVEHLVRVPLPAPASMATKVGGVLNTDILADTDRLAGLLKQAMSGAGKWRSSYAMVSLAPSFGILRYFVMPAVDSKYWRMAVPAEAKKYIPVQLEDLVSDYQVEALPPGPDRRARQGALFGVTQGKNVESVRALLQKLGVKLGGVELAPSSTARLWDLLEPSAGAPYAQIHFDQGDVHVVLAERGIPLFVREILMGADAKVADRRKLDLAGCIDFTKKQLGAQRPAKVRVSGSNAEMAAWKDALTEEAGVPVTVQDTAKMLGLKGGEWGGYAALGAAARHLTNTGLTMDLSGSGRVDEIDRRTVSSLFALAGVAAAFFLAVGAFRHVQAQVKASELRRLNARGATLPAFKGKSSSDIEKMVQDMKSRAGSMGSVTVASIKVADILEQLAEDIPEQAWLNSVIYGFSLNAAVSPSGGGRTLTLQGNAAGASESAEQEISYQFKNVLQRDPRFAKAFSAVEVSVQGAAGSGGQSGTRTSFSVNCSGRRGG